MPPTGVMPLRNVTPLPGAPGLRLKAAPSYDGLWRVHGLRYGEFPSMAPVYAITAWHGLGPPVFQQRAFLYVVADAEEGRQFRVSRKSHHHYMLRPEELVIAAGYCVVNSVWPSICIDGKSPSYPTEARGIRDETDLFYFEKRNPIAPDAGLGPVARFLAHLFGQAIQIDIA